MDYLKFVIVPKRGLMKKIILIAFCACVFFAGCTSPEQNQKIQAFWFQQYVNVILKVGPMIPSKPTDNTPSTAFAERQAQRRAAARALLTGLLQAQQSPQTSPAPAPQAQPPKPAKPKFSADMLPQMVEVTMDEEALPGKADYKERVQMMGAFSQVLTNNQKTLQDLQETFGESVKLEAFLVTTRTETQLKETAATAVDFQDYLAKQQQLMQAQEKEIEQLMTQNINSLKKIKTSR